MKPKVEKRCWDWFTLIIQVLLIVWFIVVYVQMCHYRSAAMTCTHLCKRDQMKKERAFAKKERTSKVEDTLTEEK